MNEEAIRERAAARAEIEAEYEGLTIPELMSALVSLQEELERIEEAKRRVTARADFLRLEKIPEACEALGIENIRVQGVGRLSLSSDMYVSIRSGMTQAAHDWLADVGLTGLIRPTVASSTLKAAIKKRVRDGDPVPDEIFNVYPFTRASITQS